MRELSPDTLDIIPPRKFNRLSERLLNRNVLKENFPALGLSFIRRKIDDGFYYFISNLYSGHSVNTFVPLVIKCKNVVLLDPVNQTSGKAEVQNHQKIRKSISSSTRVNR